MFNYVLLKINDNLYPFIFVTVVIIVVVIILSLYGRKNKGPYPITYIYDEKGGLQFEIYQSDSSFTVVNHTHMSEVEKAVFKNWNDLVNFIELEKKKWR